MPQVEILSRSLGIGIEMKQPCDEVLIRTGAPGVPCAEKSRPWVLAATILGSSMAFIDGTAVNVALPALQSDLHATVVDVQWVIESYGLFLSALILVGGERCQARQPRCAARRGFPDRSGDSFCHR